MRNSFKGKIIAVAVIALAALSSWAGASWINQEAKPVAATSYSIASASDFATYFNNSSAHAADSFELTADISIGNLNYYGINSAQFTGTFNGNGHTITVTLNAANSGLFYQIGSTGTVNNLNVNATINTGACCAPICFSNSGTVSNCATNLTVTAAINTIGGMAWGAAAGTWTNCRANWSISSSGAASNTLYRIAPEGQGTFTNCKYSLLGSAADTNFTPATGSLITKILPHSSSSETKLNLLISTANTYWVTANAMTKEWSSSSVAPDWAFVRDTNFTQNYTNYSLVTINGTSYRHAYLSLASTSYTIANFGSTMYFKRYSENGSSYWNEGISSSMSNIQAGNSNTILMSPSSDTAGSTSDSFGFLYKSTLVEQATYGTNTYLYSYQLYASGTNYSPSVTNTPSGYQFDGWYTDAAYTTAYTPAEMTADLTLYAKYSEVVNQYTVHEWAVYDGYGSSSNYYDLAPAAYNLANETAYSNANFTPSTPAAVTNYSFDGWYTNATCTTAYSASKWSADGYLYAKYTNNTSYDAIYLLGSQWSSWAVHYLTNRFAYNATSGLYELNGLAISATTTFKFYDATKNVYGGYLAQAFNNGNFTGSSDSDITCSTAGTYDLSILSGISSASSNYYGYWNYVKTTGTDYSSAAIYLRGSMNGWADYAAYKFTYTGGQYNLNVTVAAGDTFKFYYADKSSIDYGFGGYNSVYFGSNFTTDSSSNVVVSAAGSYHLVIRGSVTQATSGLANYWLGSDTTSTVTYYAKEYQVTGSTVSSSYFTIESAVAGAAFTPSTPASSLTPSGYEFEAFYTDSACTTAFTSGSVLTANTPLYAHYITATFKYVYFNFISASITPANLRVRMWYGTTELLSGVTGEAVASSSNVSIASSSTTLKMSNDLGLSLMVKIKIANAIVTAAGTNQIYIEFRDDTGNATTPSTAVDAAKYFENGYYFHPGGAVTNYGGHIDADHDTAYAFCYEMDAARKAISETSGAQSICNFTSAQITNYANTYNAFSSTVKGYINASQMNSVTKATTDSKTGSVYTYSGSSLYTSFSAIMAQINAMALSGGSGARISGVNGSATSTTLIIVASSGATGLLSIALIYLVSRRRKRHLKSAV